MIIILSQYYQQPDTEHFDLHRKDTNAHPLFCLLTPCLTLLTTPEVLAATSADSGEPIVVSASRSYRTVSEMAQTTGN